MRTSTRGLRVVAAATLGLAATIVGLTTAAQAAWYGSDLPVTAWTYTSSAQPDSPVLNAGGDMPVGTSRTGAGIKNTQRAYFTYDISSLAGRVPHNVNLYTTETSVQNCAVQAPVEVWRTKPVTSNSTWTKPPAQLERVAQRTLGKGVSCPGAYLGVDVTAQLDAALTRHEKTISFEVRLADAVEKDAKYARTFAPLTLYVQANAVPKVSAPRVAGYTNGCGTLAKHPTAVQPGLIVTVSDADTDDYDNVTFATFPVEHPDQRTTYQGWLGSGTATASPSLAGYDDGTVLGWQAQATDAQDASAWTKTCYLTVDKTGPATAPIVTSTKYGVTSEFSGTGGPGVPGTFVLDAGGDRDTVGFVLRDDFSAKFPTQAKTNRPGGKAHITLTPVTGGGDTLYVTAVDAAGNRGQTTEYRFDVRYSAPYADVTVNGVGVPSHLSFRPAYNTTATSFTYLLEDYLGKPLPGQDEVKVAATNNTAESDIVFPDAGSYRLRVRAYNGHKLSGEQTEEIQVSDAPSVTSDRFTWEKNQLVGTAGSFTFTAHRPDAVAYVYDFDNGDQQRVDAGSGGTAVLDWTATQAGFHTLEVASVNANGDVLQGTQVSFMIVDPRPATRDPRPATRDRRSRPLSTPPTRARTAWEFRSPPTSPVTCRTSCSSSTASTADPSRPWTVPGTSMRRSFLRTAVT